MATQWNTNNSKEAGSTLIEVAVVTVLLATTLTVMVGLITASVSRNRVAKERVVAARLAQEAAEWLRFERDRVGFDPMVIKTTSSVAGVPYYNCASTLPAPGVGMTGGVYAASFSTSSTCNTNVTGQTLFYRTIAITYTESPDILTYTIEVTWQGSTNIVTQTGKLYAWQN